MLLFGYAATFLSVLIAGYWGMRVAIPENHHEDLWIYAAACDLAWHGTSPYDTARIHAKVAEQFPDDPDFIENSGFMYPPSALLVFAPLAVVPWAAAKVLWCVAAMVCGAATGWTLTRFSDRKLPGWFAGAAVAGVLLNPLSMFTLIVGQTPLFFVAAVAVGQWAEVTGRRRLGRLLWAVAFIKPHIALPLLPLAWYLSGWRRAAEIAVWAGAMNIAAGLLTVGNPLLVFDYLTYIQHGHQSVLFNRVGVNPQITGWNRLVVANGGPAIELGMKGTLAGYAVFAVIVGVRSWVNRGRQPVGCDPTQAAHAAGSPRPPEGGTPAQAAWLTAVAGCASLACCQLLPYELPLLALILPYLGELLTSDRRADRLMAVAILLAAAYAMLPGGDHSDYYRTVRTVFPPIDATLSAWLDRPVGLTDVFLSHRCIGVLLVTAGVVGWGPKKGISPPGPLSKVERGRSFAATERRFQKPIAGGDRRAAPAGGPYISAAFVGAALCGGPWSG